MTDSLSRATRPGTPQAAEQTQRHGPRVRAPELRGRGWLNTGGRTLTLSELRGKIVVLDFWTFCCQSLLLAPPRQALCL